MKPDLVKIREAIEDQMEDDHDDGLVLAAVIVDRVGGPLHAERDALKAELSEANAAYDGAINARNRLDSENAHLMDERDALRHEFEEMTKLHDAKHRDWQRTVAELAEARAALEQWEAADGRDALPGALAQLERGRQAETAVLHLAAEAHRRKWAHQDTDSAAFDELHRIGNELRAALDAPQATTEEGS